MRVSAKGFFVSLSGLGFVWDFFVWVFCSFVCLFVVVLVFLSSGPKLEKMLILCVFHSAHGQRLSSLWLHLGWCQKEFRWLVSKIRAKTGQIMLGIIDTYLISIA